MSPWLTAIVSILGLVIALVLLISLRFAYRLTHNPLKCRRQKYTENPELREANVLRGQGLENIAEEIELTAADGTDLRAWYLPAAGDAALLLVHGFKSHRPEMLAIARMFHAHGYSCLIPELRAHGEHPAWLISFGLSEWQDLDAAYAWLTNVKQNTRIGALGNSMGASLVVLYAARNTGIRAVAAHCPYASIRHTLGVSVKKFTGLPYYPFAPIILFFSEWFLGRSLDTVSPHSVIHRISPRPVYIMAAGRDKTVHPEGGRMLYEAAGEPRFFWFEPELAHVAFHQDKPDEFQQRMLPFFDQHVKNA